MWVGDARIFFLPQLMECGYLSETKHVNRHISKRHTWECCVLNGKRESMFKKILIANRGEIACRIIKTARQMGIKTVAVYSDADRASLHKSLADESACIGPGPSAESYLNMDNIVHAIKATGADAVHPGYGFLSENADFARRVEGEGVTFIGPSADAISAMGDKIESKLLANKAKINTVPGHEDAIYNPDHAVQIGKAVGYPILLKASAGGGGKGIRIAWNDKECREGLERAINEARSSFGDDRVFIEKFIEQPRHIEVQIIADKYGNTIHLHERECSIQRRHQKILEEAPSSFLNESTRKAMGEEAVSLAKAVGYYSAGTVEFVVDSSKNFYFLEMNTRLQVEHSVTEYITGLDLVEMMIRIAAGEQLGVQQKDVKFQGWAVEARIYAEDPLRNFLPSIGRIENYIPPRECSTVRVDTGVYEGDQISVYYDPMIAKLITYGEDRINAISRMRKALDAFFIRGVRHNIQFLASLVSHPRFISGDITTNFINDEYPEGFMASNLSLESASLQVVVAAAIHRTYQDLESQISSQKKFRNYHVSNDWIVVLRSTKYPVVVRPESGGFGVVIEGKKHVLKTVWKPGEVLLHGSIDGIEVCFQIEREGIAYRITHGGAQDDVMVLTKRTAELYLLMPVKKLPDSTNFLMSPMPGLLLSIDINVGQQVKTGEPLAVIEAMKMENVLRAERDAVVAHIKVQVGDSLMVDQVIMEFE